MLVETRARVGVFATRSPNRPNPLGLSSVRIAAIDAAAGRIEVLGADLVDGTPIFDIKPYVEYADSHPGVRSGFASEAPDKPLKVTLDAASASNNGVNVLRSDEVWSWFSILSITASFLAENDACPLERLIMFLYAPNALESIRYK